MGYRHLSMEGYPRPNTAGYPRPNTAGYQRRNMVASLRLKVEECPPHQQMSTEAIFPLGRYSCENLSQEAINLRPILSVGTCLVSFGRKISSATRLHIAESPIRQRMAACAPSSTCVGRFAGVFVYA